MEAEGLSSCTVAPFLLVFLSTPPPTSSNGNKGGSAIFILIRPMRGVMRSARLHERVPPTREKLRLKKGRFLRTPEEREEAVTSVAKHENDES